MELADDSVQWRALVGLLAVQNLRNCCAKRSIKFETKLLNALNLVTTDFFCLFFLPQYLVAALGNRCCKLCHT